MKNVMIKTEKSEMNRVTFLIIYEINVPSWFLDGVRWRTVAVTYGACQDFVESSL